MYIGNDTLREDARKIEVCIVTLYKSLNYGAFLQAYAMKEIVSRREARAVFLNVYQFKQNIKRFLVLAKPKDLSFSGFIFSFKKFKAFSVCQSRSFQVSRNKENPDAYILGSDEIWNLANTSFVSVPEFFGNKLASDKKIFSYAPSCGNSDLIDMFRENAIIKGVLGIDRVSVRDEATYQFAKSIRPDDAIHRVLDPTFLYDFSDVEEVMDIPKKYCVVYSYRMSSKRAKEIRRYAKRNELLLVSPGFNNSWCDIVLPCSPFQFLYLVKNAHSIITDTYHGTIFSIKYKKNFLSYYEGKRKVEFILRDLGLSNAGCVDGKLDNIEVIETDYTFFNSIISYKVRASNQFLDDCFGSIIS